MNDPEPPPPDTLATITAAADGLLMPSESDYPFEPFSWSGPEPLTPELLLTLLDLPSDTPVEVRDALDLLDRLATVQEWFGDYEQMIAARFATLRDTLITHLTDLMLYRIGTIRITLIIVGRDHTGATVGLRTLAIET